MGLHRSLAHFFCWEILLHLCTSKSIRNRSLIQCKRKLSLWKLLKFWLWRGSKNKLWRPLRFFYESHFEYFHCDVKHSFSARKDPLHDWRRCSVCRCLVTTGRNQRNQQSSCWIQEWQCTVGAMTMSSLIFISSVMISKPEVQYFRENSPHLVCHQVFRKRSCCRALQTLRWSREALTVEAHTPIMALGRGLGITPPCRGCQLDALGSACSGGRSSAATEMHIVWDVKEVSCSIDSRGHRESDPYRRKAVCRRSSWHRSYSNSWRRAISLWGRKPRTRGSLLFETNQGDVIDGTRTLLYVLLTRSQRGVTRRSISPWRKKPRTQGTTSMMRCGLLVEQSSPAWNVCAECAVTDCDGHIETKLSSIGRHTARFRQGGKVGGRSSRC